MAELRERNLVPTAAGPAVVSPELLANMQKLERSFKSLLVKKCLETRTPCQLTISPKLASLQRTLERDFIKRIVKSTLIHRDDISLLEAKKLIRGDAFVAPMICPGVRSKIRFYEAIGVST
ncbi:hypothetical protein HDU91_007137 [Kappamyces sp. JEL0680]|nr:hypothetical protein HDU91_007137 [Kappamyces sp. JEL0680]